MRIRAVLLKVHVWRVLPIYPADITVIVDSQAKVFSVKWGHLSVDGVKSKFRKQSDGFASQRDLSGASTECNGWDYTPLTTDSSWADLFALQGKTKGAKMES